MDGVVRVARAGARCFGRVRRVEVIVYKVDRLGDWFFAEPSLARIVAATRAQGGSVVIWASRESALMRRWRECGWPIETLVFEPKGVAARARRMLAAIRLLAIYEAKACYSLRHGPDPIRDFVVRSVRADDVRALSWRIGPGEREDVPNEIWRHHALLRGLGCAPDEMRALLPVLAPAMPDGIGRVIVAPFSSAEMKDWPEAAWMETVRRFGARATSWELWVGPDQIARASGLADGLRASAPPNVRVVVRSGSLTDLMTALRTAELVVAVDTMAAHLAVACDARLVGILGGGQYGDFAPWARSARQRWVSRRLPCYHCNWDCTQSRNECLQQITPERVVSEMVALWAERETETRESPDLQSKPAVAGATT